MSSINLEEIERLINNTWPRFNDWLPFEQTCYDLNPWIIWPSYSLNPNQ